MFVASKKKTAHRLLVHQQVIQDKAEHIAPSFLGGHLEGLAHRFVSLVSSADISAAAAISKPEVSLIRPVFSRLRRILKLPSVGESYKSNRSLLAMPKLVSMLGG